MRGFLREYRIELLIVAVSAFMSLGFIVASRAQQATCTNQLITDHNGDRVWKIICDNTKEWPE